MNSPHIISTTDPTNRFNITDLKNRSHVEGVDTSDCLRELVDQHWDHCRSLALTQSEGIDFKDEHLAVIVSMLQYYPAHGLPMNARTTARALNENFSRQGGSKYLRRLVSERPVTQGSRLAICVPPLTPPTLLSAPATVATGFCSQTQLLVLPRVRHQTRTTSATLRLTLPASVDKRTTASSGAGPSVTSG